MYCTCKNAFVFISSPPLFSDLFFSLILSLEIIFHDHLIFFLIMLNTTLPSSLVLFGKLAKVCTRLLFVFFLFIWFVDKLVAINTTDKLSWQYYHFVTSSSTCKDKLLSSSSHQNQSITVKTNDISELFFIFLQIGVRLAERKITPFVQNLKFFLDATILLRSRSWIFFKLK